MKNFKISKIIICVLIICFLFTGCNDDRQNLKDLTVVQGVGIDDKNDKTKVSLQYLNLTKGSTGADSLTGNITAIAQGNGNTISDAVSVTSKSLSKKIFFAQNKIVFFGKKYAEKNIAKGLDYLLRSVDSRPDVAVAISEKSAEDIIKNKERDERIPAQNVYDLLLTGEENGLGAIVKVDDLLNLYADKTSDIYLPVVKSNKDFVSCEGIAIFSDEKYKSTMNESDTFGFLFIKDKIDGGSIIVKNEKLGNVGLEIISSKTKNKMSVDNGKLTFNSNVTINLVLDEVEKGITTSINEKDLKTIEQLVGKKANKMCHSAFDFCVKNNSDPFMMGKYLAKTDMNSYNQLKGDWKNNLSNIDYKVTVHCQIKKVNDNSVRE